MKKVINVGIGGRTFIIDEDAYQRLDAYLTRFQEKVKMGLQTKEVIEEVEIRIAELFTEYMGTRQEVVNIAIVNRVISQLGMPDGTDADKEFMSNEKMHYFHFKRHFKTNIFFFWRNLFALICNTIKFFCCISRHN